jgi:predicted  nucleic acid-binding Zn-ribbon protein
MTFDLSKTVANLRSELQELCKQRKHVEMRMVNVNLALSSLAREIEDANEREDVLKEIQAARRKPAGLTEAIAESLRQTHHSLSAEEVRYWLEMEGFDLSQYSQPLATISVTLRRLEASGRVKATRVGRKVRYKWIGER